MTRRTDSYTISETADVGAARSSATLQPRYIARRPGPVIPNKLLPLLLLPFVLLLAAAVAAAAAAFQHATSENALRELPTGFGALSLRLVHRLNRIEGERQQPECSAGHTAGQNYTTQENRKND